MGRHIRRVHEFDYTQELNNIIDKYRKSGYFSKSDQRLLDNISGYSNFVDVFAGRVDDIIEFFDKYDPMEFENILMDIFDECYYKISIYCLIYPLESQDLWRGSDTEPIVNIDSSHWETTDKMYLIPEILSKLNYGKRFYMKTGERFDTPNGTKKRNIYHRYQ